MFSYNNPPNYIPIINEPFLYMVGLGLSNDATTPNAVIDINKGQCRDSTDAFDINLNAAITINILNKAAGGLDTGSVVASKMYAIVLISDPVSGNPTNAMFTLTPSAPSMPLGYSVWRVIGYCATDSSSHILKGQWTAGGTGYRKFVYDTPQATSVAGSGSTTYAPIDLVTLVPSGIAELPVNIFYSFTSASSGSQLSLQGFNRTSGGYATIVTVQGAGNHPTGNAEVISELNSSNGHPEINYKTTNSGDSAVILVSGYSLNF